MHRAHDSVRSHAPRSRFASLSFRLRAVVLIAAAAHAGCGSDRERPTTTAPDGAVPAADGATPVPTDCEPVEARLLLPNIARLLDVDTARVEPGGVEQPLALVDGEGLSVVGIDGTLTNVAAIEEVREAALARRPDGIACAIWVRRPADGATEQELSYGCAPDFAVTASTMVSSSAEHFELSETTSGSVVWFKGNFASASALVRSGATFTEQELFESSISWFGDATSRSGDALACLIASGGAVALYGAFDAIAYDRNIGGATGCMLDATEGGPTQMLAISSATASLGTYDEATRALDAQLLPIGGARDLARAGDATLVLYERRGEPRLVVARSGALLDGPLPGAALDPSGAPTFSVQQAALVGTNGAVHMLARGSRSTGESSLYLFTTCESSWPTTPLGEGGAFERVDVGTTAYVRAVSAASDGSYYLAVVTPGFGDSEVVRVQGDSVTRLAPSGDLADIVAIGPRDVWAVGGSFGGVTALHYDGTSTDNVSLSGSRGSLSWVDAAADGTLFVLSGSCLMRATGTTLEEVMCSGIGIVDAAFFDGTRGFILDQFGDVTATDPGLPIPVSRDLRSLARIGDEVWGVGSSGAFARYDGATWHEGTIDVADGDLLRVHAIASDDVWALSETEQLLHWDGATWSTVDPGTDARIEDLGGTAETGALLVGEGGLVLRQRR